MSPLRLATALPLLFVGCGLIDPIDPAPSRAVFSGSGGAPDISTSPSGGKIVTGGRASTGGSSGMSGGTGAGNGGSPNPNTGGSTGGLGGGASGGTRATSCSTNRDCGALERCLPSLRCVSLVTGTSVCPEVLGAEYAKDPRAVFVGAFAPLDDDGAEARTVFSIYDMVTRDFNEQAGGLRGSGAEPASPLVVVLCNNDNLDKSVVQNALRHLIETVKVPAVLAAMDINQLRAAVVAYRSTFFVSALGGSEEFASISNGQAWTMLGQPADYADIYAALMPHIEVFVRRSLEMRPIRVAAVIEDQNAFQRELSNAVRAKLTFNGQSLLQNLETVPPGYMSFVVAGDGSNTDELVEALHSFQPDVVFSFAGDAFTAMPAGVMTEINQKYWPNQRPFYVLSPENQAANINVRDELRRLIDVDSKASGRILGVGVAQPTTENKDALQRFLTSLNEVLPNGQGRTDFGNYYDAFYFLTYAMYASGPREALFDGTVQVSEMAKGMRRLINLTEPAINIHAISSVFDRLDVRDLSIQLMGTLGVPDFNSDTGMRREAGSVYCFNQSRQEIQSDVIRFDRATNRLIQESPARCLFNFLLPQ